MLFPLLRKLTFFYSIIFIHFFNHVILNLCESLSIFPELCYTLE